MADKKIINEAIAQYKDITDYAMKEAKQDLEKTVQSKLEEMLDKQLEENISIEKDGVGVEVTDDSVTIEKGDTKVTVGDSEGSEGMDDMGGEMEMIPGAADAGIEEIPGSMEMGGESAEEEGEEFEEESGEAEEEEEEGEEEAEEIEETLFEIKETITEEEEAEAEVDNPFAVILKRLDDIESKIEGGTSDEGDAEGEVEIVDDEEIEEPGEEAGAEEEIVDEPAEEPAGEEVAEEPAEEPVAEEFSMGTFEEGDFVAEEEGIEEFGSPSAAAKSKEVQAAMDANDGKLPDDMKPEWLKEDELEEVIEIVDEDNEEEEEDDSMEEMHGVSHSVSTKGQSSKFGGENNPKSQSKRITKEHKEVSELKAQYDSNIEELNEENDSLRKEIEEYKNSFIDLRTQFHEMNTLNAKLALANNILTNGGLTNDEKVAINEAFAEASNAEEAKKVYNKIIKEHSISIKRNGLDKVRSSSIKAGQPTNKPETETLYESEESKRWQSLAGIKPLNG